MTPLYAAFTERLFAQNQFSIKLGLERVASALAHVGHPESTFPSVVIAGTNGKGTTAVLLASILTDVGLRVGLTTSPHLIDLRERFRVDGVAATEDQVLEVGLAVLATFAGTEVSGELLERGLALARLRGWGVWQDSGGPLTFFELTTVIALLLFNAARVDIAVLEVGLGGRLDAVNVVDPVVTVITAIGLDHQRYLGTSIRSIAAEKGSTMRCERAAVIAYQPEPDARRTLGEMAATIGADLRWAPPLQLSLPGWLDGDFAANVGAASEAASAVLSHLGRGDEVRHLEALERVVKTLRWPGRRDYVSVTEGPLAGRYLLDAAHNPAGAATLADYLEEIALPPTVGVLGAMADKDVEAVAAALSGSVKRWIATRADTDRAATAQRVAAALTQGGATDVHLASTVSAALAEAHGDGPVLICGSIYLIGEAMIHLGFTVDSLTVTC